MDVGKDEEVDKADLGSAGCKLSIEGEHLHIENANDDGLDVN